MGKTAVIGAFDFVRLQVVFILFGAGFTVQAQSL
jgi:hypothetical protein